MSISEIELSRIIDEIIALGEKDEPTSTVEIEKHRVGRPESRSQIRDWSLDLRNPAQNRSFVLISLCIKEDFDQTLDSLAAKVAFYRNKPRDEVLNVLQNLQRKKLLGYYDNDKRFRRWTPNNERKENKYVY